MKITDKLSDKNILIWGYGREGKSTEKFIRSFCKVKSVSVFEGDENEIKEDAYDYIIKSPGIKTDRDSEKYTSQTELFLEEFSARTIGITGTKGKSTIASMLYSVLSNCLDREVLLVGNIGFPCLDYYSNISEDTVIIFEMSCHQLAHTKVSPHIAVFLNLFEEHLDYYKTMENYFRAKTNITIHQNANDHLFVGDSVPSINTPAQKHIIKYDTPLSFDMLLKGEHNQFNAAMVYAVSTELFHCRDDEVRAAISAFKGLPHRMEFIANVNGIDFYDDSISTIPEATIQAVHSIANTGTVLIGGMDRHIHYGILVDFISQHPEFNYILMYASGARIYKEVSGLKYCYFKDDLTSAVALAKALTAQGRACILSPAAASYGYFKNFEERGNAFKNLVLEKDCVK